jgi:hypothetical protein
MTSDVMAGEVVATKFKLALDWSDPIHWDDDELADCRSCGTPTHSRDSQDRPIHESCALRLVIEQVGQRGDLVIDEQFPTPAPQPAPNKQKQTEVAR